MVYRSSMTPVLVALLLSAAATPQVVVETPAPAPPPAVTAGDAAAPTAATPAQGGKLNVVADNAVALPSGSPPMLEAPRTAENLANARSVAKENPAAVANIVRGWVKAEDA